MALALFHLFTVACGFGQQNSRDWDNRSSSQTKPNILFIFVDDLRPELGCYGNTVVQSPNIDRLAAGGVLFTNQFVVVPTCGASRACLLTGKRPAIIDELSNDVLENKQEAGISLGTPETFVENLRLNGYFTVGIGKISHSADGYIYKYLEPKRDKKELPQSWDEIGFDAGKWQTGWNAFFAYANGSDRNHRQYKVKPYECADVGDEGYPDGLNADLAVQKLGKLAQKGQPFFLGVGFFKPHLPFNAPKKYWDMYDESAIPLAPYPDIPREVNPASLHESNELNNGYQLGDQKVFLSKSVSNEYARKLRHGYYAAVSYTDAQIGKVLDALQQLGLDENTIVLLWSDHGWHLGDDRVWGKHTLFDWSLRSPLIVRVPKMTGGMKNNQVISSIDIYPTLMELCGIKSPSGIEGKSFLPLLADPDISEWNNVAYSYFKRGISMRTGRYRLTRYFRSEKPNIELFDHYADEFETNNIYSSSPHIADSLIQLLELGNTGLYSTRRLKHVKSSQ